MKSIRLLKNTHLLRCAHPSSLRRTVQYASFLTISRALHPDVFDQPGKNSFFNNLLVTLYLLSGKPEPSLPLLIINERLV